MNTFHFAVCFVVFVVCLFAETNFQLASQRRNVFVLVSFLSPPAFVIVRLVFARFSRSPELSRARSLINVPNKGKGKAGGGGRGKVKNAKR